MGHHVVALALPDLITFDLTCALQIFGHGAKLDLQPDLYEVTVCGPGGGRVRTYDGFDLAVNQDLDALDSADTVVVPATQRPGRPDQPTTCSLP